MSKRNELAGKVYGKEKRKIKIGGHLREVTIQFVAHPVDPETKAKLQTNGRIVDVLFAPESVRAKYITDLQAKTGKESDDL